MNFLVSVYSGYEFPKKVVYLKKKEYLNYCSLAPPAVSFQIDFLSPTF